DLRQGRLLRHELTLEHLPAVAGHAQPVRTRSACRNGLNHNPSAAAVNTTAAAASTGSTPTCSASTPATGASSTTTARFIERIVVLVRACSSSGVICCR